MVGRLDDIAIDDDDDEETQLKNMYKFNYVFMCHNYFLEIKFNFKLNLIWKYQIVSVVATDTIWSYPLLQRIVYVVIKE